MKCSLIYRRWWFFYFTMLVYFFRHPKWRGWSQVEKKCCFLGTAGATIFIWSVMMTGHQLVNCEFLCVECMQMYIWLVVWNMNFIFHNIWDNPSHWLICFRGVETTNQMSTVYMGVARRFWAARAFEIPTCVFVDELTEHTLENQLLVGQYPRIVHPKNGQNTNLAATRLSCLLVQPEARSYSRELRMWTSHTSLCQKALRKAKFALIWTKCRC